MIKRFLECIADIIVCVVTFAALLFTFFLVEVLFYRLVFPDRNVITGGWAILIVFSPFVLSALCTAKVQKKRKSKDSTFSPGRHTIHRKSKHYDVNKGKIPYSIKAQTEMSEQLYRAITLNDELMSRATNLSLFINWYDESLQYFETLAKLKKVSFQSSPQLDLFRRKNEFQWHLCDAIVRVKEHTISEIKGNYKNSKEFQINAAKSFEEDIKANQSRFSADTSELAASAVREINDLISGRSAHSIRDDYFKYGGIDAGLLSIDLMEGHDFEYWCADLLRNIGFTNVEVTQGSGDQGVDILAAKDGIRYAIQCKCYSKNLDNKPVQEVNAGKMIYHCHVGAVMTNRYFTSSAKKAAEATDTLLWDRDWIADALNQI